MDKRLKQDIIANIDQIKGSFKRDLKRFNDSFGHLGPSKDRDVICEQIFRFLEQHRHIIHGGMGNTNSIEYLINQTKKNAEKEKMDLVIVNLIAIIKKMNKGLILGHGIIKPIPFEGPDLSGNFEDTMKHVNSLKNVLERSSR